MNYHKSHESGFFVLIFPTWKGRVSTIITVNQRVYSINETFAFMEKKITISIVMFASAIFGNSKAKREQFHQSEIFLLFLKSDTLIWNSKVAGRQHLLV